MDGDLTVKTCIFFGTMFKNALTNLKDTLKKNCQLHNTPSNKKKPSDFARISGVTAILEKYEVGGKFCSNTLYVWKR